MTFLDDEMLKIVDFGLNDRAGVVKAIDIDQKNYIDAHDGISISLLRMVERIKCH